MRNLPNRHPPLYRSFAFALSGIGHALLRERNLRIHTAAAAGVFCFAPRFSLSRGEWALLLLVVALVLVTELVNSAIENLTDLAAREHRHPLAKAAKDIAAGAALVAALGAVCVGVCLFWDLPVLAGIWREVLGNPVPYGLGLVLAVGWVILPGRLQRRQK